MSARLALLGSAFMMALASGSANAATLIGATVDGSFKFPANTNNYFDPSVGFVPAGYLNSAGLPVTVEDPAKEFGFSPNALVVEVDFTGTGFTVLNNSTDLFGISNWTMQFSSPSFVGLILQELSDTFDGGLTASLVGGTLVLSFGGTLNEGVFTASYSLAPVPIPAALPLFATGVAAVAYAGRRKRKARAAA